MRLGITAKLFLGVLATSVLVALVVTITGRIGFQRDFGRYVEAMDARRAEALAESLAAVYTDTGDWSRLAGAERHWRALLRGHHRPPDGAEESRPVRLLRHAPRLAVYDATGQLVVGNPDLGAESTRHPVVVDGETVGWIARARSHQPTETADLRFQQAQLRNLGVAAVAAVLFAALAAALLSRVFLAPAREIGRATHRLAAGDFEARAQVAAADEFGQLAVDFNLLARTLQRNEAMRRRMMADVAHELRTPLAVIQGELAAVEDGVRPLGPATLSSLHAEVRSLGKLIDDLYQLALSDVGALSYRRRDLDLRSQVAEALLPLNERCSMAGLELDDSAVAGDELPVLADPDRLVQLVTNLIENAVRYTDAPGRIEVACRRADGRAILTVNDSAPGVAAEAMKQVFDRFFRAEGSRSRASGGAGLGLAICRNIVEAHEGAIAARPSPLGGLTIEVSLPLLRHET